MSDNIQLPNTNLSVSTDEVNGTHLQKVKLTLGGDGDDGGTVSNFNPMPVKLDATSLAALENISVTVENPSNSGLTDTQLRATPVPVSMGLPVGASTEATLAALKTVIDGLKTVVDTLNSKVISSDTDNISGEVSLSAPTLAALENTTVTVTNPTPLGLTDTQLRATALPVSISTQPLPTGAATESTLASLNNKTTKVDTDNVTIVNSEPIKVNDDVLKTLLEQNQILIASINDMTETVVYALTAMLDKMGRLDRFDRLTVQIADSAGNEINSAQYGVSTNFVGETSGKSYSRILEPQHFSNMGTNLLYQNIKVI